MPTVRIKGLDRSIEVEAGADLRKACIDGHVNLFWGPWAKTFNCRGKGFCNLCKVEVVEGAETLTPPTKRETKRLKNKPGTWRLACCTKVQGDIEIDPFPVRHPPAEVSPEALRRALLDDAELKELEEEDWAALHEDEKPVKKAPKKGLLAKVRKTKGIDDSDVEPTPGKAVEEAEEGDEEKKPKKGLLGKAGKKKDANPKKGKGKQADAEEKIPVKKKEKPDEKKGKKFGLKAGKK